MSSAENVHGVTAGKRTLRVNVDYGFEALPCGNVHYFTLITPSTYPGSVSKTINWSLTKPLVGIRKVHRQSRLTVYDTGYPGEANDPEDPFNIPPHPERKYHIVK